MWNGLRFCKVSRGLGLRAWGSEGPSIFASLGGFGFSARM